MINFKPTWLMIKKHNQTGLKYFCKTTRPNPHVYKGSGVRWALHLKKHGRDVSTIWCKLFTDMNELMYCAITFSIEHKIVESKEWANLVIEDGITGWPSGTKHSIESVEKCRLNANGFKKGYTPHNKGKMNSVDHYHKQIAGQVKYREENPNWSDKWLDGKRKAEPKRIAKLKELMTGSRNHNYDSTVYTFKHKKTSEIIKVTRNELITKYGCQSQNVYRMIKGAGKSVSGWQLVTI